MGRENSEKIVVEKDYLKKKNVLLEKFIIRLDL